MQIKLHAISGPQTEISGLLSFPGELAHSTYRISSWITPTATLKVVAKKTVPVLTALSHLLLLILRAVSSRSSDGGRGGGGGGGGGSSSSGGRSSSKTITTTRVVTVHEVSQAGFSRFFMVFLSSCREIRIYYVPTNSFCGSAIFFHIIS